MAGQFHLWSLQFAWEIRSFSCWRGSKWNSRWRLWWCRWAHSPEANSTNESPLRLNDEKFQVASTLAQFTHLECSGFAVHDLFVCSDSWDNAIAFLKRVIVLDWWTLKRSEKNTKELKFCTKKILWIASNCEIQSGMWCNIVTRSGIKLWKHRKFRKNTFKEPQITFQFSYNFLMRLTNISLSKTTFDMISSRTHDLRIWLYNYLWFYATLNF